MAEAFARLHIWFCCTTETVAGVLAIQVDQRSSNLVQWNSTLGHVVLVKQPRAQHYILWNRLAVQNL